MFSKNVTYSARFLKMPLSTQALYFHLGMNADDDGIVEAFTVMNTIGSNEDELRILSAKGFVKVLNEDFVTHITDWNENNLIRADRKKDSVYQGLLLQVCPDVELLEARERAVKKESVPTNGQPMDVQRTTSGQSMDSVSKDKISKDNISKNNNIYTCAFAEFWKEYPRKKEKAKAYKCYQARLKDGYSEEELLTSAKAYKKECEERNTEERYIKLAATFLGASTPFIDYLKKDMEEKTNGEIPDYWGYFEES